MFAHTVRNCRRFEEQIERLGMNETERGWMRQLLALFDRASAAANASYFVYGGSLLGFRETSDAERNHDSNLSKMILIKSPNY